MKTLAESTLGIVLSLVIVAKALDDRLGVCTHFDQGWSTSDMSLIPGTGAAWIRDDLSWGKIEVVRGQYSIPESSIYWINAAGQYGLKVDLLFAGGNDLYADPYDVTGFTNALKWLSNQLKAFPQVQAIEIVNEPNNDYRNKEGSGWKQKYAALLSASHDAVKSANPKLQVIGAGAQAGDDFAIMAYGVKADGLTAHPYPVDTGPTPSPEGVYEPPYFTFKRFCEGWVQHDKRPRWDTEWGLGTYAGTSQYTQALYIARRLCQSLGMGVSKSFIYDLRDDTNQLYGLLDNHFHPKLSYQVVQRIESVLSTCVLAGGAITVDPNNSDPKFDHANFYGFTFHGAIGTVAVAWNGDGFSIRDSTSHNGQLSFFRPTITRTVRAINVMTGATWTPQWSTTSNRVVILSTPVTNEPILYIANSK